MWWEHVDAEIELEFLQLMRGRRGILTALSVANPADVGVRRTIRGRWYITPHAVSAYIQRVKKCTRVEALADLAAISQRARFVKEAHGECELWRGPRKRIGPGRRTGGIRLIVGPGEGDLPALLTVLGEHDDASAKSTD